MTVTTHQMSLLPLPRTGYFFVSCSCGWEFPEPTSRRTAVDAWTDHCDETFFQATMKGAFQ